MRAVVLAGGLGTRLRGVLGADTPKPLAPVAGRPFLEWVLLHLARQGVTEAVISTGYRADKFEAWARAAKLPLKVRCVAENEPLGTAGGFVHAAAGLPPGETLLCNGDTLVLADLSKLRAAILGRDAAVLGVRQEDASRYGRLETDAAGALTGFSEKRPGSGLVNAGVWLFSSALLSRFPAKRPLSLEVDVIPGWLREGAKIGVAAVDAPFIDIGIEQTYAAAGVFIKDNASAF